VTETDDVAAFLGTLTDTADPARGLASKN